MARRPTPHFGLLGLFPCVTKEVENLPSDVEDIVLFVLANDPVRDFVSQGKKIIDYAALAISRSRILHARASKIVDFVCLGDISNHDLVLVCQGKHNHRLVCFGALPKHHFA